MFIPVTDLQLALFFWSWLSVSGNTVIIFMTTDKTTSMVIIYIDFLMFVWLYFC